MKEEKEKVRKKQQTIMFMAMVDGFISFTCIPQPFTVVDTYGTFTHTAHVVFPP